MNLLPAFLLAFGLTFFSPTGALANDTPDTDFQPWHASSPLEPADRNAIFQQLQANHFTVLEKLFNNYRRQQQKNPLAENTLMDGFFVFNNISDVDYLLRLKPSPLKSPITTESHERLLESVMANITQWIGYAPKSPNPYIARAYFLEDMALRARGEDWARDTPPENFEAMRALHAKAIDDARKALTLDPSHPAAYRVLINISRHQGNNQLYALAIEATEACPGSFSVWYNLVYARSQYTWGRGSPEEGLWLALQAQHHAHRNPRLRSLMGLPFAIMAAEAENNDDLEAAYELYSRSLAFGDLDDSLLYRAELGIQLGKLEQARKDATHYFTYFPGRLAAKDQTLEGFLARIENAEREKFKDQGYWE